MEAVPNPPPPTSLPGGPSYELVELLHRERLELARQLGRERIANGQLREEQAMILGMLTGAALVAAVYLWFTLVLADE